MAQSEALSAGLSQMSMEDYTSKSLHYLTNTCTDRQHSTHDQVSQPSRDVS